MASFQRPNRLFLLLIFCLSTVLAACSSGGGGKGGSSQGGGDTRPDNFTITAPAGVDPTKVAFNAPIVSAPVTITGIDAAAPVSIAAGQFSIDGGTFASTASTVRNGQKITVRLQSPIKAGQTVTATLNVGGVTAPFTVTTQPDTTPPEVAVLFPPPASMTEGETLFVRGTVKDVHGTLKANGAVMVNGIVAEVTLNESGDEGNWQVEVDLEDGLNSLAITSEDAEGNDGEHAGITVTKASITNAFPSEDVPLLSPIGVTISAEEDHYAVFLTDPTARSVISVDLKDGTRSVLSDNTLQAQSPFDRPWRLTMGTASNLYVTDRINGNIYLINTQSGDRTILNLQDPEDKIQSPTGIAYFPANDRLYVAHDLSIFSVAPSTGAVAVVADYSEASPGESLFTNIYDLAIDAKDSRILATDYGTGEFASISLPSGDVEVIGLSEPYFVEAIAIDSTRNHIYAVDASNARVLRLQGDIDQSSDFVHFGAAHAENAFVEPWGIAVSPNIGFAVIADPGLPGLVAMDIESGRRVIISKSATPE